MQRALALTLAFAVAMPAALAAEEKSSTPAAVVVTTASSKKISLFSIEDQLIRHVNATRQQYGLPSLQVCEHLMGSARQHCYWMARSGSLQHTQAAVAENIALGQQNTTEVMQSWMNSPGHRANILGGGYTRIGAAAYQGSGGRIFWCLQFLR